MRGVTINCVGHDWKNNGITENYFFPDNWNVKRYAIPKRPTLDDNDISDAVRSSFIYKENETSLAALAAGKKNAVILFDDISRPTPTYRIANYVLNEIIGAGVSKKNIRFICALGTHRRMTVEEFEIKLGKEIVINYKVENHDCFSQNTVLLGRDSYGTNILINKDVISADLIIGISTIEKHAFAYSGGGSKIILPGVAAAETIRDNHNMYDASGADGENKYGFWRASMNESADMVSRVTDFIIINTTVSAQKDITSIYIGDAVDVYNKHVDEALKTYTLPFKKADYTDIGVFRMDTCDPLQASKTLPGMFDVCGIAIITGYLYDGQVYSGLRYGPYEYYEKKLKQYKERENMPMDRFIQTNNPIILCSESIHVKSCKMFYTYYVTSDWNTMINQLAAALGPNVRAAFFEEAFLHRFEITDEK